MTMLMVSAGRCQFCHRTDGDVAKIFAGDSGYICDECVRTCANLLVPTADQAAVDHDAERFAYQRLIRHFAPLRRRLVMLYARGLLLPTELLEALADRTEGASPAFIKELLRRIAQHHIESGSPAEVATATADSALHEMLFSGGALNKRLLGGEAVETAS